MSKNVTFSRIDIDTLYLQKALECYKDEGLIKATVRLTLPHKLKIDEKFIMQRFERMDSIKYDDLLEKDYLERFVNLKQDFINFIYETKFPTIDFEEGNFTLFGSKASIYLSFNHLRNLIADHLISNFLEAELIMEDVVMGEGVRKMVSKFDMVRNSDFKFIEAGTAKRYSYGWQMLVFNSMVADLKPNIIGTTNPIFGLLYGIPLHMRKGEGIRPVIDFVKDGDELEGSIYEMLHCYIHRGERNKYLWSDLMSDVINLGFAIDLIM